MDTDGIMENPTVLIVDDSPDDIALISNLLKDLYRVKIANNGERALKLSLTGTPPDIILLDIMMPVMDGYETCRHLKASPETTNIPVIFLTSKTELADEIKGFELGAVDYITKPISPPIVLARVQTHLQLKRVRDYLSDKKVSLEAQLLQAQKMDAIGTLAGGVAHDFNNILGAIIGYTEMAMDEDQKEIRQKYLQENLKGAERAKDLVRQILTFSRQESQEKKPLDIKLLLQESLKFLRASIPATIEIQQHVTDESCSIMGDPTQMHQVIMNLCTNATHAMKQAGGVLTIELAPMLLSKGEILLHPDLKPGPYLRLTVSDTGHGIDPANIHRIFDPFFTTKSREEGTGLGLSVVYGIIMSHDGAIHVHSEPGKGANFVVYLPRIIHQDVTSESIIRSITGGTEQILFVDDEHALVEIAALMLSSLGYEVTGATSSNEALDLFRAAPERFDLVITDMTLPKMTGLDLSREILQIRPDIPIVLCSGIREADTEEQAMSMGIKAYCLKPFTKKELSRVIRETLDGQHVE